MNLLVEIGNTALKAAWSDGVTLGKTFRYQGEKVMDFILGLIQKEKPEIMAVASVYEISEYDRDLLKSECPNLLILDPNNKETLQNHKLPYYLTYDRAAAIIAARYLFKDSGCTIVDFGTTLTIDNIDKDGMYEEGFISLGCRTRFKALNRYSRALPLLDSTEISDRKSLSLEGSMVEGVISGIIFEIQGHLDSRPGNKVVFTGGDANFFAKRMKNSIFVVCNLVLMGLALIADEHVRKN